MDALPPIESRTLAEGRGWRMREVVCRLGPEDQPYEERHDGVSIAAVLDGSFFYHSSAGRALLYPGALLLGNAGTCFTCGHEHGRGDRCVALHFAPEYFEEIASAVAGTSRFRFVAGMLPAHRELAAPIARLVAPRGGDPLALEEAAIDVAETAIAAGGGRARALRPSGRDERRIDAALRYAEAHAGEPLDLDRLASAAFMSKYHFLRTFRRVAGVTPHQFLLSLRLRRAAEALRSGDTPVSGIALDAGFGDLSGFNARFRAAFGVSPGAFRRGA